MAKTYDQAVRLGKQQWKGYPRNFEKKAMFRMARRYVTKIWPDAHDPHVQEPKHDVTTWAGKMDRMLADGEDVLGNLVKVAAAVDGWTGLSVHELLAVKEASSLSNLCGEVGLLKDSQTT